MNFLLAWVIFTGLFFHGIAPVTIAPVSGGPTHSLILPSFEEARKSGYLQYDAIEVTPMTGSVAENMGLKSGDLLLSIDQVSIDSPDTAI